MNVLELVSLRRSVREYRADAPVPPEVIERCLEAARLAPSACNAQPWRFVVVNQEPLRSQVAAKTHSALVRFNRFADAAPLLVVIVAEEGAATPRLGGLLKGTRYCLMDIGIAAEHFALQAAEEGLGCCMLGWFDEAGIRRALGIPKGRRIALVLTVGYPADPSAPRRRGRKSLEEIRSYNRY